MSQHLTGDQRFAEDDPFPDVLDGHIDDIFAGNVSERQQREAFMLELFHLIDEALAFVADSISIRNSDVVKKQLGGVADMGSELFQFSADRNAGQIGRDHQQAERMVAGFFAGFCQQCKKISLGAIGDINFAPVNKIVATVFFCRC